MYLNEAVIPHYRSAMVPTNKLKKRESNSQIKLKDSTEERITRIFEDKIEQFKRILKY